MEATTQVNIQSLTPYRHLFPAATGTDKTVKKGATVSDTVELIPMIVKKTRWQVKDFVNEELQGLSTYSACEKLWNFVKYHIRYKKDKRGVEQVRSPRRLIHDAAGDCDCFTTFIDTCLSVLNIPVINRITKYKESYFQHIYPIVPMPDGGYITMDCVVDRFNYEEPYTEKKDFNMDLQYLDGIEDAEKPHLPRNVDTQDLFGWDDDEMGEIGKLFKRNKSTSALPAENQGKSSKRKGFQKFKNIAKKVLNVVNKANPATALLRAGILASMKLNIMKVAQRLKWGYLTPEQAKAKGADMSKFDQLKKVLYKMEQIFYSAGGKPENLKKSILTGRGNRNKEVSGLGEVGDFPDSMNENTPLPTLLGDIYHDEFVNGLEGTEGLGIVESAAIAASTTVMGTIAALIKKIGNLFPNHKAGADFQDTDSGTDNSAAADTSADTTSAPSTDTGSSLVSSLTDNSAASLVSSNDAASGDATNGASGKNADGSDDEKPKGLKAFWENNKKWLKPVGITTIVAGVAYVGYRLIKRHNEKKKQVVLPAATSPALPQAALAGMKKKGKKKKKGKQSGHGHKSNIALM